MLEGIRPQIADEAKTAPASKGVVLNSEAQALFLDCVLPEFIAAIVRLERVAGGNYEADERPSEFPKYDGRPVRPGTTVTPWALFGAWATATQAAPSTVDRWRSMFLDLDKRYTSAGDITEDDAREWARRLVTPERGPRTVNDVWITSARTVFGWAVEERMISANPFEGVRVAEPRRVRYRESRHLRPRRRRQFCVPHLQSKSRALRSRGHSAGCRGSVRTRERGPEKSRSCAERTSSGAGSPRDADHASGGHREDRQGAGSADPRASDRARIP